MKISLHIEEMVIEGASLTRREREHLAAALEQELVRQLRQRAGPDSGAAGGAAGGSRLGAQIAGQVLAALPAGALPAGPAGRRQARAVVRRADQ